MGQREKVKERERERERGREGRIRFIDLNLVIVPEASSSPFSKIKPGHVSTNKHSGIAGRPVQASQILKEAL